MLNAITLINAARAGFPIKHDACRKQQASNSDQNNEKNCKYIGYAYKSIFFTGNQEKVQNKEKAVEIAKLMKEKGKDITAEELEKKLENLDVNTPIKYKSWESEVKCKLMHFAAEYCNAEVINSLHKKGADIYEQEYYDDRPSHAPISIAINNGNDSAIKAITDIAKQDNDPRAGKVMGTALVEILGKVLYRHGRTTPEKEQNFNDSKQKMALDILDVKNIDVNCRTRVGDNNDTALCLSIDQGYKNVTDKLLEFDNINPDLLRVVKGDSSFGTRSYTQGPIHIAASKGDIETMEKLLAKGATLDLKDSDGATSLHNAAATYKNNSKMIEFLVKKGLDVNTPDKQGYVPLHYAVEHSSNPENVRALLNLGAKDIPSENGTTADYLIRLKIDDLGIGRNVSSTNMHGQEIGYAKEVLEKRDRIYAIYDMLREKQRENRNQ